MECTPNTAIFLPRRGLMHVDTVATVVLYGGPFTLYNLRGHDGSIARVTKGALALLRARPACTKAEMQTVLSRLGTRLPLSRRAWTARDRQIIEQLDSGSVADHGNIVHLLYQLDGTEWAYSRFLHYDTALRFLAEEFAYLHECTHEHAVAHIRQHASLAHNVPA